MRRLGQVIRTTVIHYWLVHWDRQFVGWAVRNDGKQLGHADYMPYRA